MSDRLVLLAQCSPNIDAQRVYAALYLLNCRRFGRIAGASLEWLTLQLETLGFKTERKNRFSRRTTDMRLRELVKAKLVTVKKRAEGRIDITIDPPQGWEEDNSSEEKSTPVDAGAMPIVKREENTVENAPDSERLYSEQNSTKTETVFCNDNRFYDQNEDTPIEEINININKQINKQNLIKISVNEEVSRIDFTDPEVKACREKLVREIYEPTLHADLVDRAVAALRLRYVTPKEFRAAINESKDVCRQHEATRGYKGKYRIWETFALRVKGWFDAVGVQWEQTSFRREQAPSVPQAINSEDDVERILLLGDKRREEAKRQAEEKKTNTPRLSMSEQFKLYQQQVQNGELPPIAD